jgi:hypothetical protein
MAMDAPTATCHEHKDELDGMESKNFFLPLKLYSNMLFYQLSSWIQYSSLSIDITPQNDDAVDSDVYCEI